MSDDDFPFSENPADAWGGGSINQQEEEPVSEADMARAISLVEQGNAIDQVIGGLFGNLPEHIKQKIMQKLQQVAQEKQAREHEMARQTREKSQERKMGFSKLFNLSVISSVISRETIEKIQMLFSQNPQLRQEIGHHGMQMLERGVQPEIDVNANLSGPSNAISQDKAKQQQQQR